MGIFGSKDKTAGTGAQRRDEPHHDTGISQSDKAKLELRRVRSRMRKLQAKYEAEAEKFTLRIKEEMRAGRKDRARTFLRLRKLRQTALARTDNQIVNLEQQLASIKEQEDNIEYVRSLEMANKAMEELQKIMPVDYVSDVLDRNQELQDINAEISEMLAGDGICAGAVDEDEILDELAALEAQIGGKSATIIQGEGQTQGLTAQEAMSLPVAPSGDILSGGAQNDIAVDEEERVMVAA